MTTTAALQPLTPKQRQVFDWIVDFYQRERIPPTIRELQAQRRRVPHHAADAKGLADPQAEHCPCHSSHAGGSRQC